MKVELTNQQADVINEAFGLALQAIPPNDRVAVSANSYAPILQLFQQASKLEQTAKADAVITGSPTVTESPAVTE